MHEKINERFYERFSGYEMKDGDTASRIKIDELFNPTFAQLTVVINIKEVIKYVFINKRTKGFAH